MGSGFIQLITQGQEHQIFNKEPQITFFKIYYRRHTNFFINNYEIEGNYLKDNSLLTFTIPKSGDFLSKSFLRVSYEQNYTELLEQYPTLLNTLNTNILDFYNSYSVKINTFDKDMIKNLKIAKVDFINNNKTYLSIQCTNFKNTYDATEIFKNSFDLYLQENNTKTFYNINEYYNFYGFNMISSVDIFNNYIVLYFFEQINWDNLEFMRVDIENYKTSFRFKFDKINQSKYLEIFNLIFSNYNIFTIESKVKIDSNTLYISFKYDNTNELNLLYNQLIILVFQNINLVNLKIIDNKIKSSQYTINKDVFNTILKIVSNINTNYYTYYYIYYNSEITNIELFTLKDVPYFGNFTTNDFNENLLNNETKIINTSNLSNNKLSINIYIRLLISLICNYGSASIQEYIKIIFLKQFDLKKITNQNDIALFNRKILNIFINPNVLILSNDMFKKILYQNSVKNNYFVNNNITPFTNRKVSIYQTIIINYYIFFNILARFSSRYNQTYDSFEQLLGQIISLSKVNFNITQSFVINDIYYNNYKYNNNIYDVALINIPDLADLYKSLNNTDTNSYVQNIITNAVILLISESINIIKNIYNKNSDYIYTPNGYLNSLFYNMSAATSIFPFSSNIFMYSEGLVDYCSNNVLPSTLTLFNVSKNNYYNNIYLNVKKNIEQDFNLFKTNFNNNIELNPQLFYNNQYLFTNLFTKIDYFYSNIENNENQYNQPYIKSFLYELTTIDFSTITKISQSQFNLNEFVMKNLFIYTDNSLYNNSFANFTFKKQVYNRITKECTYIDTNFFDSNMYLSFIFTVNSPIYRIYYLFTYFYYMYTDPTFINNFPSDLEKLINITLIFILEFIKFFNNINNSFIDQISSVYNVSLILNSNYNLINNFLCFDQMNLFSNTEFKYALSLNPDNPEISLVLLFQSFYFNKSFNPLFNFQQTQSTNDNNEIFNEFINNFRYNYDDKIIIVFLKVLELNKLSFYDFNSIYSLVNLFFNKSARKYTEIIANIELIYNKSNLTITKNELIQLKTNPYYFNNYYTIYAIGTLFDSNDLNNLDIINNTFNLTLTYNNYNTTKNFYSLKSNDSKQFQNYLENFNIINVFEYLETLFNNLLLSYNAFAYEYYLNILNNILSYVSENFTYLLYYNVNKIVFNQCFSKIFIYLEKYNSTNNTNVTLLGGKYLFALTKSFVKNNIICIILIYLSFLYNCLSSDVNIFISNTIFSIDFDFNTFIIEKYSVNIYIECLNDLINILSNAGNLITLDYNTIYLGDINPNIIYNSGSVNINQTDSLLYMQKIYDNDLNYTNTNKNILYDLFNKTSFVYVNTNYNINKSSYFLFYSYFNNNINNYIYQYNKVIYSLINGGLNDKVIEVNNITEKSLQEEYVNILIIFYNNSIYTIENNIYKGFKTTFLTFSYKNNYTERIVNILLNTIKYFYEGTNSNYYDTIYFKKCKTVNLDNTLINDINNNQNSSLLYINNLVEFSVLYLNQNILRSLNYEKELNRLLYLFATNYAVSKSFDKSGSIEYLKGQTLYNITKLYISNKSPEQTYFKEYKINNLLYSDIDIFQLLNYENWSNYSSFLQNKWFNVLISKFDSDPNKTNSFYYYYTAFRQFCLDNIDNILLVQLNNGIPVINYFYDISNLDELNEYIFNFITGVDAFSPNTIYNSIINLRNEKEALGFMTIDTDNIKKKIIIYLYFNYLIYSTIHLLLIEYFSISPEINFEYTLLGQTIEFNVQDILTQQNLNIIYYYITSVYSLDDNNINNLTFQLNTDIPNYYDILYIINTTKKNVNIKQNIIILFKKFISSYELIVGNDNFNSTNLADPIKGITISNCLKRINTVFNNDVNIDNLNKYFLTINTIKTLNIGLDNTIYGLDNIYYNTIFYNSSVILNMETYYSYTDVSNINIIFNLVCSSLLAYSSTYSSLNDDINLIIGNLRLASKYVNDTLEFYKGLSSNYQISYNQVNISNSNSNTLGTQVLYGQFYLRYDNINILSTYAYDLKNLSIITPSDYDLEPVNISYKKIYLNFFKKYYLYNYNFYNFPENFTVIFPRLLDYYTNIINNSQALVNLQSSDVYLYKRIFNEIITTILSNSFFVQKLTDPHDYLPNYNYIVKIFKQFNFTFKINQNNISNQENLILQNFFNTNVEFTDYTKLFDYLLSLYYYMLLYSPISNDKTNSNYDLVLFFNYITKYENYNFLYNLNLVNIIYRVELSVKIIVKIVEYYLNISLIFNGNILNDIINKTILIFTDKNIISDFIYTYNIKFNTQNIPYTDVFNIFVNIIEYEKLLENLSKSFEEAIFYTNNFSIDYNLNLIWEKYWSNTVFEYYDYTYNSFEIKSFVLNYNDFFSTFYYYLNFFYENENNRYSDDFVKLLSNYFIYLFRVLLPNDTFVDIDFTIIYQLIFELPMDITGTREEQSEYFTQTLIDVLIQNNWGLIFYNNISNTNNKFINSQILFSSFYYAYVNYYNLNPNYISSSDTFNYKDFILKIPKLQILYNIIIKSNVNEFIDTDLYYKLFNSILLNCYTNIYEGNKIEILDLSTCIATFLDFYNKNLISNNIINNNYKTVQDETIKDIIFYKVNTFINSDFNFDSFSIEVYNLLQNQEKIFTENNISLLMINNSIISIINNYSIDVNQISLLNSNIIYIDKCFSYIVDNININLDVYKNILGGYSEKFNNMYLSTNNIISLFNGKSFVFNDNIITIFTIIYNKISVSSNNDIIVILFYYNCYITWLSTYGYNYTYNLDTIIYDFANLINTNILKYIDYISTFNYGNIGEKINNDSNFIQLNNFFNGLNEILFGVYNNLEYIQICQKFFNEYIYNYYNSFQTKIISESVQFIIKTFDGYGLDNPNNNKLIKDYFNSTISNEFVANNKLNVWKYFLGLCVDPSKCEIIKQMKSIYEINPIINYQVLWMNYIKEINGGYINELGILKILEYIRLNFDDELIDSLNQQMYKIFVNLNVNLNIYPGIQEMLGLNYNYINESYLTTGITSWIIQMAPKNFYIPLNFFFKDNQNAIPLISCMYTNIYITALFNSKNIFKDSYITNTLKPYNVTTGLNMDFVFVEREERIKLTQNKIDNLVETHGNYIKTINFSDLDINIYDDNIILEFEFEIGAVVKEIIWELTFYLDSFKIIPNNYKKNVNDGSKNIYDFILNTKFYIDGARRDGVSYLEPNRNNNAITTYLNPYRYNTRANANNNRNLNVYSFALEPEEFQPTGAINLNLTRVFSIQVILDKKSVQNYADNTGNLFDLSKLSAQINLTTIQYNLIRYQSGLSGLLFVSNNTST